MKQPKKKKKLKLSIWFNQIYIHYFILVDKKSHNTRIIHVSRLNFRVLHNQYIYLELMLMRLLLIDTGKLHGSCMINFIKKIVTKKCISSINKFSS